MKLRRMNKLLEESISPVRLVVRRFLFFLRQPPPPQRNDSTEEQFSGNPVELVVQVSGRIDRMLSEIGLPKGRGIGERLAILSSACPIKNNISSLVTTRNRMIHSEDSCGKRALWFNPRDFIFDYYAVKKYLQGIEGNMKREDFQQEYLLQTGGKISALEYAEKCTVEQMNKDK